jgi:hypothetical protein
VWGEWEEERLPRVSVWGETADPSVVVVLLAGSLWNIEHLLKGTILNKASI